MWWRHREPQKDSFTDSQTQWTVKKHCWDSPKSVMLHYWNQCKYLFNVFCVFFSQFSSPSLLCPKDWVLPPRKSQYCIKYTDALNFWFRSMFFYLGLHPAPATHYNVSERGKAAQKQEFWAGRGPLHHPWSSWWQSPYPAQQLGLNCHPSRGDDAGLGAATEAVDLWQERRRKENKARILSASLRIEGWGHRGDAHHTPFWAQPCHYGPWPLDEEHSPEEMLSSLQLSSSRTGRPMQALRF